MQTLTPLAHRLAKASATEAGPPWGATVAAQMDEKKEIDDGRELDYQDKMNHWGGNV